MNTDRVYSVYEKEIQKDKHDIEREKEKFVNAIKNGLGEKINDINTYIKPEVTLLGKIKNKLVNIFKYL